MITAYVTYGYVCCDMIVPYRTNRFQRSAEVKGRNSEGSGEIRL